MLNLVIVVLVALSLADAGDVLTLTDADFDSRLAGYDMALVKFYAPWYVHVEFNTVCHYHLRNIIDVGCNGFDRFFGSHRCPWY